MKKLTTFLVLLCVMGSLFAIDITTPDNGGTSTGSSTLTVTLITSETIEPEYRFWISKEYGTSGTDQTAGITEANKNDAKLTTTDNVTYSYETTLWWECQDGSVDADGTAQIKDFTVTFTPDADFKNTNTQNNETIEATFTTGTGYFDRDKFDAKNLTTVNPINPLTISGTTYSYTSTAVSGKTKDYITAYSGKIPFTMSANIDDIASVSPGTYQANVVVAITYGA